MSDSVQQIKDKLSIVDVVSQYVKLERSGASLRARCPFHAERTPSFFVSPERGTYHCFGCGVGGDIFSFVQAIEGLDFKGALKVLAEKAGVEIVYARSGAHEKDERERLHELLEAATIFYTSHRTDSASKYLKERGISEETARAFRLGLSEDGWTTLVDYLKTKQFSEKEMLDAGVAKRNERGSLNDKFRNRIMFPISDSAGRVVGFSGRAFGDNVSPDAPKYLNSPETPLFHKSRILYGLDKAKLAIRKHDCAVLVEGQIDLLASHQAGWSNTIAVSGTAFTPEHAALIRRFSENLVIALDPDPAGLKAAAKAARIALEAALNVKVARLPEGLDPADLILKSGKDAWSKAIREAKDIIIFLLDVLEAQAKTPDNFRRSVETIVLSYLQVVKSPIAREQHVREIARRLSVSEHSVIEALGALPQVPEAAVPARSFVEDVSPRGGRSDRARNAFSLLLWQKALQHPVLDLGAYEKGLEESIGKSVLREFSELSEGEHEQLRFLGERLYGQSSSLKNEGQALLTTLLKDRLSHELADATAALKKAESLGIEEEVTVHMSVCNVLTKRLAELHRGL